MRNTLLVLASGVLLGCEAMQPSVTAASVSTVNSQCVATVPPPSVEVSPDLFAINGVTVTPTLTKKLLLNELGRPCREVKGTPGTHTNDGYLYDKSLGVRFHTRPGMDDVIEISFSLKETQRSTRFNGKLLVMGKELPLDTVLNIQRAIPEMGLGYDSNIDPRTAKVFGFYQTRIGEWEFNVRADSSSGVVEGIYITFQSIICSERKTEECFDRKGGRWRAP